MVVECDGCDALFEGIPKGCASNVGGVKAAYFTELCNVEGLTLNSPDGKISAFNMLGSSLFYAFYFDKNTANFTEKEDPETGLRTQELKIVLKRREKSKRDTLALIGMKKDLAVIVTDNNGLNWYLGEVNGVNMTQKDSDTGTVKKDINRYDLTFMGEEPEDANEVTDAALAAVI